MSLRKDALSWRQVAGLGIALVIAGQFSGWNYGLVNGWGNMAAATLLMAVLCFGLALCVAELSAAEPSAGGLYVYCERAFGSFVGYIIGFAIFAALAMGAGAVATFIAAYCHDVLGIGGWPLKLGLICAVGLIHTRSVGEVIRWIVVAGILAFLGIFAFLIVTAPHFAVSRLATPAMPLSLSWHGMVASIPFAIWLFISVEQTAAASEEIEDPGRAMPKGVLAAISALLFSAIGVLFFAAGAGGIERIAGADAPLYAALTSPAAAPRWLIAMIGLSGVTGLIATLFSVIYAASRQVYALARDGHLPAVLGRTNALGAPGPALLLTCTIGVVASMVEPDRILPGVVLSLSLSYIVLLAAFVQQRQTRPELHRPFRVPAGMAVASTCLILAILVFAACFQADPFILGSLGSFFAIAIVAYLATRLRRNRPPPLFEGTDHVR